MLRRGGSQGDEDFSYMEITQQIFRNKFTERERERERDINTHIDYIYVYVCVCVCVCVCAYVCYLYDCGYLLCYKSFASEL